VVFGQGGEEESGDPEAGRDQHEDGGCFQRREILVRINMIDRISDGF